MLKLIVRQKGKILKELALNKAEAVEYTIGRGKDNDLVLPAGAGISRKHLILSLGEDKQWTIKNLSQVSPLIVDGEETNEAPVHPGGAFQVQDMEFTLWDGSTSADQPSKQQTSTSEATPALFNTESKLSKAPSAPTADTPQQATESEDPQDLAPVPATPTDKTRIMDISANKSQMAAYLKVSYDDSQRDIFKLEDQEEWTFGRDETADIMVDNSNISREHFKIKKEKDLYYIEDLKSSNGTIVNDKQLKPGKAYPIQSGDVIYILDVEIDFEIKNLALEKKLAVLKPGAPPPVPATAPAGAGGGGALPPVGYVPPPQPANLPGVIVEMPEESQSFFQKNKKRLMIYGAVALIVGVATMLNSKEEGPAEEEGSLLQAGELAGLSAEQAQIVRDTYQVAQQLYTQGKFEYCRSEIKKIHSYTNSYQDSKKLEIACTQAAENKRRQYDLEQKKQKAERTEQLIKKITDNCKAKFETFKLKHELVACLNQAIELAPADSRIHSLTERFDMIEMEKEEKKEQIAKRKQFIQSIMNKYHYAKSLSKSGKFLKAMAAYQRFINQSNHRELGEMRERAKRELASIKKTFNDNNNKMNSKCAGFFKAGNFHTAYYTCEKASKKIPPPHNKKALDLMSNAKQKLEIKMKPIYEEANLNESVGNVSIAMEYWKKIIKQDVKTGLYYNRAREKMDKY